MEGFEPSTSSVSGKRANQTAPHHCNNHCELFKQHEAQCLISMVSDNPEIVNSRQNLELVGPHRIEL